MFGRAQHVVENTVQTLPDLQAVLIGFDMNIRGIITNRLRKHQIDQPDDRRIAGIVEEIADLFDLGKQPLRILVIDILHHLVRRGLGHIIGKVDRTENMMGGNEDGRNRLQRQNISQIIEGLKTTGIIDGDELLVGGDNRYQFILFQKTDGNMLGEFGFNIDRQGFTNLHAELPAQGL